jgi:hypothetical protein
MQGIDIALGLSCLLLLIVGSFALWMCCSKSGKRWVDEM